MSDFDSRENPYYPYAGEREYIEARITAIKKRCCGDYCLHGGIAYKKCEHARDYLKRLEERLQTAKAKAKGEGEDEQKQKFQDHLKHSEEIVAGWRRAKRTPIPEAERRAHEAETLDATRRDSRESTGN